MTQPWLPQHPITPEAAAALISSQFPELRPVRLELLGVGWDNTAFRVNDSFVFRFPRREIALALLETERRLMPKIATRLPLEVPLPTHFGRGGGSYPWPFLGHRYVTGHTACSLGWRDQERARLTLPLAKFLAALHSLPVSEVQALGVTPDRFGKLDFSQRIPQIRANLAKVLQLGLLTDIHRLLAIVDSWSGAAPRENIVLVHGDLYARHLLVTDSRELCGIIDWGDAHLGNPATDLSVAHMFLPPSELAEFRASYGAISDECWQLSRLRALSHATVVVTYGHEARDAQLINAGTCALRFIAAGN